MAVSAAAIAIAKKLELGSIVALLIVGLALGPHSPAPLFTEHIDEMIDLVARLVEHRVIVNLREGAVRAAPHFYNTTEEVDRLISVLPRG